MASNLQNSFWIVGETKSFNNDYELVKEISNTGQYGQVYRCLNKSSSQTYVVKILDKTRYYGLPKKTREKATKMLKDEILIMKLLSSLPSSLKNSSAGYKKQMHSTIIKLEDIYEDVKSLYIVMEECKGGELFNFIINQKSQRICDEKLICNIMRQILTGISLLHNHYNIVHCDLKPSNILILDSYSTDDNNDNNDNNGNIDDIKIKIVDFGMSKILSSEESLPKSLCGTPYYTAPEIILKKGYDYKADMWSIGVILYILCTGYPPFYVEGEKYNDPIKERNAIYKKIVRGFNPNILRTKKFGYGPWFPDHIPLSEEIRDLISELLAFNPNDRLTAEKALQHPFIVKNTITTISCLPPPPIVRSRKLKSLFNNVCKSKLKLKSKLQLKDNNIMSQNQNQTQAQTQAQIQIQISSQN